MQQKSQQVNLPTFLLQFRTLQEIRKGQKPPAGGSSDAIPKTRTTCTLNVQQNSSIKAELAGQLLDRTLWLDKFGVVRRGL